MHVAAPHFGERIPDDNLINQLISTTGPLCSTDVQMLLLDAYETVYGIYDHAKVDKHRPLVLVAKQWAEDVASGSLLHERMEQYHDVGILKFFGIPWDQWIEQPKSINDEQILKAKKWGDAENGVVAKLQAEINALKGFSK